MIKKFGSLFAGHVDLDHEGLEGTPVNERWLPDEYLATVFPKAEAIAKVMDRTGYDTYWLAEHHFQREGYECIPNVLMLALHLCHVTRNIRIGCGFNIAPMWHPIRMAEDYATVDWLTRRPVGFIGGGAAAGGASDKVVHAFREARARAGRETELGGDLCIGYSFHIADSVEQGIKEATPFFEENIKMFAPLGFVPGLTPEQIDAVADPKRARQAGLPTLRNALKAGTWLIGPPELITEQLMEVQHKYPGLEVINVGQPVGTPEAVILEQLERFAAQVMPAFKRA